VTSAVRPVPGAPALVLGPRRGPCRGRALVVADLHLGLGGGRDTPGGPPEASAGSLAADLLGLAVRERVGRILVAGDAKHPIVGVPAPLRPVVFDFFSRLLEAGLEVDLVPGNHDTGLARHLPREVAVHSPAGIVVDGTGVFHGHRWPSEEVLRAPRLVAGHLHPGFRFAPTADDPRGKRRCWVRVTIRAGASLGRSAVPDRPGPSREMVIVPAFNPLAGIEALNRDCPARGRSFLYRRFISAGSARAYLFDGTDLGPLPTPAGPAPRRRSTGRGRPGR
jgi:uncharacterized protein